MAMNDTIAVFLTSIRNACRAEYKDVQVAHTVVTEKIARVMFDEGYLGDVQVIGEGKGKKLVMRLKYMNSEPVIAGLQRVSKLSRRVYVGYKDINAVMNGLGLSILSTPAGIMSDKDAKKNRVGGEVLCNIW